MRQQDRDRGGRWPGRLAVVVLAMIGPVAAGMATPPPAPPVPPAAPPAAPPTAAEPPQTPQTPAEPRLTRVAAVGASATHGFFAQTLVEADGRMQPAVMDLGDALAAVIRTPSRTSTAGSVFFFQAPDRWGPELLEQALATRPTLLVGVDYLFWFGYGATGHRPGTEADAAARRARLDRGLALLEQFGGPVAVGDLPDMSAAIGGMLSARQVPSPEVRTDLNRRIAEWAAERPEVTMVGLSDLMARLQAGERLGVPGTVALLKPDKLHPTADGLLVLAREILRTVDAARPEIEPSMLELDHAAALTRLRAHLAARLEAAAGD